MLRFTHDYFDEKFIPTIGYGFETKTLDLDCGNVKLQIFDTSGSERFKKISYPFYKNANGFIISF